MSADIWIFPFAKLIVWSCVIDESCICWFLMLCYYNCNIIFVNSATQWAAPLTKMLLQLCHSPDFMALWKTLFETFTYEGIKVCDSFLCFCLMFESRFDLFWIKLFVYFKIYSHVHCFFSSVLINILSLFLSGWGLANDLSINKQNRVSVNRS